jgi:tetratricopeptide (TPR) repeat protein
MEILIRLAGVQLGPYSEVQVRQHLTEGLLSLSDSAQFEGMDVWVPLSELMSKVPPTTPAAVTVPALPKPSVVMSEQENEIPEGETPKRAPSAGEGVTHLPTRRQDSGVLGRKTVVIGPTGPSAPPARSPSGHVASSLAQTAPLVSAQGTKKVSRAALVKSLSQNTAPLPNRADAHPAAPPSSPEATPPSSQPDGSPPPSEPRAGSRPDLIKSLTAKTVPMRSAAAPPAPPVPAFSPITTPMPSRPVVPPTVPPSSVIDGPTKKPVQPDAEQSPEPLSFDLAEEVKTAKIDPPTKKTAESKGKPTLEKDETTPIDPFDEQTSRSLLERIIPPVIYASAALALVMIYYVWSPYHAAAALSTALNQGDPVSLAACVDFDSVRGSLKNEVKSQLAQSGLPDDKGDATSVSNKILAMLDQSIDRYVTPEGIAGLVKNSGATQEDGKALPEDEKEGVISPEVAGALLSAYMSQQLNQGLASISDFVIARDSAILHLQYHGLGWTMNRIGLRSDLGQPGPSGMTAPLVSPVVDSYLQWGNAKLKGGMWDGAIADFTQVLAINPHSSVAYTDRALARESKGDLDGAIKDYSQALTVDPRMAQALEGRGNAKASKNDLDGAIADYNQAVKIDPTMATAYDGRGNVKIAKNDLEGAVADFTQAITYDPQNAQAYSDRGFARQANGNLDGAISDYTQALALKPKTARSYYNRGLARLSQGNLGAAIVDFDRALVFDPKIAEAYFNRGNAKNATHDLDGAIADYTQAVALDPKNSMAYSNRGLARQTKGDYGGAVADYSQALTLDPKIADAYFNRGLIEVRNNNPDGAIADTTQALYLEPKNAQAYYYRGLAKMSKGNLDGAAADLRQFCDMAPRDRFADYARLYLWLIAKQQNPKADVDQELSDALENSWSASADELPTKTASFLLGRTNETDYLAASVTTDEKADMGHRCETFYFAGMKRMLTGDRVTAVDYFQKCVATGQKDFFEYILAQNELQVLAPATTAPPAAPAANPVAPPAILPAVNQ